MPVSTNVHKTDSKQWNRRIINAFWLVSLIYILGQLLFLILDLQSRPGYPIRSFLIRFMLIPNSIILLILVCIELLFRYYKKFEKYFIIIPSIAISYAAFFDITYRVSGRQLVLLLPIFLSVIYFDKKVLTVTFIIDLSIIWAAYIISPYQRHIMSIYELIIVTFTFMSCLVVGRGIVKRGYELLSSITALVKNEETLIIEKSIIDKLSKTDALTGLYNHRTFHDYADTIFEQSTFDGFQMQLAIIDIDNFKNVNDTYGHWSGDIVLKEVAKIIHTSINEDDFDARYGGEEFAIIFIGKSLENTMLILEKIRQAVESRIFIELDNKAVTVSIGVHNYSIGEGKEILFKSADRALYKAKNSGKNRVVLDLN